MLVHVLHPSSQQDDSGERAKDIEIAFKLLPKPHHRYFHENFKCQMAFACESAFELEASYFSAPFCASSGREKQIVPSSQTKRRAKRILMHFGFYVWKRSPGFPLLKYTHTRIPWEREEIAKFFSSFFFCFVHLQTIFLLLKFSFKVVFIWLYLHLVIFFSPHAVHLFAFDWIDGDYANLSTVTSINCSRFSVFRYQFAYTIFRPETCC